VTVASSLIGVIAGATLQYFLTLKTQDARLWAELRTKAYIQYVENTTKFNVLQGAGIQDRAKLTEVHALQESGRYLIALYGSKAVVDAMARYLQLETQPASEKFRTVSTELFAAMRNDLLPVTEAVPAQLMRPILFPAQVARESRTIR
jgi:hypothetical protein